MKTPTTSKHRANSCFTSLLKKAGSFVDMHLPITAMLETRSTTTKFAIK